MLPEETKQRIEREAVPPDAPIHYSPPEAGMWSVGYTEGFIAGATAEAKKAQQLADALLSAKAYLTGLSAGGGHMFTSIPSIITEIDNALQQWRGEK